MLSNISFDISIGFDIFGLDQNVKEDEEGIEKSSIFRELSSS